MERGMTGHPFRARPARRPSPRDEAGIGLIEVVVSALLVVLVGLGVYAGLDAASATSGVNKHRSLASELAQQDQDRMRAMALVELSNYRESIPRTVGNVTYTVDSRADWTTDRTGTATCTGTDARANYLRISTKVSWANMGIGPIAVESLVAPPNGSFGPGQGSLAIQVNDRNGTGLPGVPVTLAGLKSYTDTTNDSGCVLWGYLPVGDYTVTLSRPGYVDPTGVAQPSKSVSVVGQATNTISFDYDAAATIVARFDTWDGAAWASASGGAFSTVSPSSLRTSYGTGVRGETVTATGLFPFPAGYGAYAGSCAGNDPLANGQSATVVPVEPGGTSNVTLHEPPMNVRVVDGAAPVQGATVKLTGTGSGCGALPDTTTDADGYILDRAQPLGTYTVCTAFTPVGQTALHHVSASVASTSLTGVSATLNRLDSPVLGACP
jgi:Tfp pilus assembly protein PilV